MNAAALVASSAVGGVGGGFSGYDESQPGFHAFAERDADNGLGHPQPHWRQCALFAAAMSAAATACAGGLWGDARVWAIAPESPRWLAKRGRDAEVVKAIATVRGLCETDDAVLEEARLVIREVGGGGPSSCFSISHLLTRGSLSKQVVKCLALVLVTTCGGLAFSFRNVSLANVSGFEDTDTSAFAASCFKLFGIALCAFLLKAQKCGRRVLLLASLCGMTLCDVCVVCSLVLSPPDSALGKTGDTIRTLVPLAFNFAFGAGAIPPSETSRDGGVCVRRPRRRARLARRGALELLARRRVWVPRGDRGWVTHRGGHHIRGVRHAVRNNRITGRAEGTETGAGDGRDVAGRGSETNAAWENDENEGDRNSARLLEEPPHAWCQLIDSGYSSLQLIDSSYISLHTL